MSDVTPEEKRAVYDVIRRRRDVRKFKDLPVSDDVLVRILNAAHQAGSVGFMQPWNFIVIRSVEKRRAIFEHVNAQRLIAAQEFTDERREKYLSYKLEGILESAVNICVTCDPTRNGPAVLGRHTISETDVYSTCCAIQNLWLAARAEGIGVGWVSILKPEFLRDELKLPSHVIPVGYLCVGYPVAFEDKPMLESSGWLARWKLEKLVFEEMWEQQPGESLLRQLQSVHSV